MKQNPKQKAIPTIAVVILSALILSACNRADNSSGETQPTPPPDSSQQDVVDAASEDYLDNLRDITSMMDDSYQYSLEVDLSDPQETLDYVTDAKTVYQRLRDLQAPPEMQLAQDFFTQGAEAMILYLDKVPDFCALDNDHPDFSDTRLELAELYALAVSLIAEGNAIALPVA